VSLPGRCRLSRPHSKRVTATATVDHGISYGVYFLDRDGHQLEVFQQRTGPDEDQKAVFRNLGVMATPIDPETIVRAAGECRRLARRTLKRYFGAAAADTFATSSVAFTFCTDCCTRISDADTLLP